MRIRILLTCLFFVLSFQYCKSQDKTNIISELHLNKAYQTQGSAARIGAYTPYLMSKKVGVVANQSSIINDKHLVDTLLTLKINITKIFTPEHGFRGNEDAGATINNSVDSRTSIPIISLYGKKKKPSADDLSGVEVVLFDLQDVGTRFYTYISTLTYVMEACAENNIPLIVLDRPNPNGYYIDGPILEQEHKSFVGLHSVPIVYALTIGEYGLMVNSENWLSNNLKCNLTVIPMLNYDRYSIDELPVMPSPNLPNYEAVYLYPSLCLFEGTVLSVGRGTDFPFQVFGHPQLNNFDFDFTPKSKVGAAKPKLENQKCFGKDLRDYAHNFKNNKPYQLNLSWLIDSYNQMKGQDFFINYFEKLAGTSKLRKQIESGMTEEQIRASWQEDLDRYKKIRAKYLLYPDL